VVLLPSGAILLATGALQLPTGTFSMPTGTVGLQPAGQLLAEFSVSDLSTAAPVAYQFPFTTSQFTNFYHLIHSFQDEIWDHTLTSPPDLSAAVSSSTVLSSQVLFSSTLPIPDAEARAYESLAALALGTASAQNPPQVDVTRLFTAGKSSALPNVLQGWLLTSPEPLDWTRTAIMLSVAGRITTDAVAPGAVKITETELGDAAPGDAESVTVLARETIDLSGYGVQYRQMPSVLQDDQSNQSLWNQGSGITAGQIVGDQTWSDYRVSTVCHASVAGGIGIQFRYVDAQNYYAFTYDFVSGAQQVVKVLAGVTSVLASATGDPAPGIPNAPAVLLTVSVQGSKITAYRAGKNVLATSDTANSFLSGGVGALAAGNSSALFDSLEVHQLPNELSATSLGPLSTEIETGWTTVGDGTGLVVNAVGSSSTDFILHARVRRVTPGTTGILFRYQSPSAHYRFLFMDTGQRLDRVQGSAYTTIWSSPTAAPVPLPLNQLCEIAISAIGTAIRVFQDGVPVCEVVDPTFASGSVGLCAAPGIYLEAPQLLVYPASLAFSNWTLQDQFQQLSSAWSFADAGDINGPSNWQVAGGRLTQSSAIGDSTGDPARRGTIALLSGSTSTNVRVVARMLDQTGAIGVVFGYQDANNFYRFAMDPGAAYRRLESSVNGTMTVLASDSVTLGAGHDCLLVLDLIDDYVTGWMDGTMVFQCKVPAMTGLLGLYCSGSTGASFANFRVGAPAWCPYYKFGRELPISAGNRVKITSAKNVPAPNSRTSIRVAADLDDPTYDRLPPNGAHLQVVAPDQTVIDGKEGVPTAQFTAASFQALRKADATGVFLAPSAIPAGSTVRLSFQYQRGGTVAYTEAGDSADEIVFIDLPTDASGQSS